MMKIKRSGYTIKSLADILEKATEVFGDRDKALYWYTTPNPVYGNLSPYQFCKSGKTRKVFNDLQKILL